MKKVLLLILAFLFLFNPILANNEYDAWLEQEIVFLPKSLALQKYGYHYSFRPNTIGTIPYKDLAYKSARIIDLKNEYGILIATFKTEDGKLVYGKGYTGRFDEIGFKSELDNAKQYIGKTIWVKENLKKSTYTIEQETDKIQDYKLKNIEELVVVNVDWSTTSFNPIKFTLKRLNDELVCWNGSYSRINDTSNRLANPFEESWFLTNPQEIYPKWTSQTWKLIQENKITIGMEKEMVLMSWGEPKKVNKTITANSISEQWVYSLDSYVYFDNGIVSAIQN